MPGDNVRKEPTLDEQMAVFKGFSTQDGEVANPAEEDLNPTKAGLSSEEKRGGATLIQEEPVELGDGEEQPEDDKAKQAAKAQPQGQKKAKTVEERIAEVTKARRTAERQVAEERAARRADNERWEARFKSLEDRLASGSLTRDKQSDNDADDPNAPKPSAYEYGELDTKYIRDLARYEAKKELEASKKTQDTRQKTAAETAQQEEVLEKAKVFEETGAEAYDDFEDVVIAGARANEWALTPTVGELILDNPETGVHVAYYLASNPNESRKVAKMKPLEQARWVARKELEFSSAESPAAADDKQQQKQPQSERPAQQKQQARQSKATQAPPPPASRARGGNSTTHVSADTTDFAAFEAMATATRQ